MTENWNILYKNNEQIRQNVSNITRPNHLHFENLNLFRSIITTLISTISFIIGIDGENISKSILQRDTEHCSK